MLELQESKYRTVIESATDGFCLFDSEGRLVEVNDACCHLIGYTREEIIGKTIVDFEVLQSAEAVAQNLATLLTTKMVNFETAYRCKDGSRIPLLVKAVYIADSVGWVKALIFSLYIGWERVGRDGGHQ